MEDQIDRPQASQVGHLGTAGVNADDRKCLCRAEEPEWVLKPGERARFEQPPWAATASVLLVPEWQLTERQAAVKERWHALIVEAQERLPLVAVRA
jgi:hypothetical protein